MAEDKRPLVAVVLGDPSGIGPEVGQRIWFLRASAKTRCHDQGQIALKLLGFERAVTIQGGLPIPVTTPGHGTAFDIVGKGSADVGAFQAALRMAVRLARGTRQV